MTSHYLDLTVIPDPETTAEQVLEVVYDKLHLALVNSRTGSIGVSFPRYSITPKTLGNTLRLHGTDSELQALMRTDWLRSVRDHVRIASITEVPPHALHRVIKRRQFKTSVDRLRRRRMRRKGETEDQVCQAIPNSAARAPTLPHLCLRSRSTQQRFCLIIEMGPTQEVPHTGAFSSYGLSNGEATIPWF